MDAPFAWQTLLDEERRLEGDVRVLVEVSRFDCVKRRSDGSIDFVSPVPCPFNYGSILGTLGPDGEALDAVLLGPRVRRGEHVATVVVGRVHFVDGGHVDPKYVCATRPVGASEKATIDAFFRVYAMAKRAVHALRGKRGETAYHGAEYRP